MNRPSPDDMNDIIMAEQRARIEELEKENKELKAQIAEYDDLTEELDYRKREAKRLGWSSKKS